MLLVDNSRHSNSTPQLNLSGPEIEIERGNRGPEPQRAAREAFQVSSAQEEKAPNHNGCRQIQRTTRIPQLDEHYQDQGTCQVSLFKGSQMSKNSSRFFSAEQSIDTESGAAAAAFVGCEDQKCEKTSNA